MDIELAQKIRLFTIHTSITHLPVIHVSIDISRANETGISVSVR